MNKQIFFLIIATLLAFSLLFYQVNKSYDEVNGRDAEYLKYRSHIGDTVALYKDTVRIVGIYDKFYLLSNGAKSDLSFTLKHKVK